MKAALIITANKLKHLSAAVVSGVHIGNLIKPLDIYTGKV